MDNSAEFFVIGKVIPRLLYVLYTLNTVRFSSYSIGRIENRLEKSQNFEVMA